MDAAYGKLPLSFEANDGQTDRQVKFLSRGGGYNLFLAATEARLVLTRPEARSSSAKQQQEPGSERKSESANAKSVALRMQLLGANSKAQVSGMEPLPGKVNYFIGNDTKKWRSNLHTYAKVKATNVYDGVDLIYYGNQRLLEYDFVIAPGADASVIRLGFDGADKVSINDAGELIVATAGGDLRWHKPVVYQDVDGVRRPVDGRYAQQGKHQIGFQVGAYDRGKELVIDPVLTLVYATYLGGSGSEHVSDFDPKIAVDASGHAYVAGGTNSWDFPTTLGAFQTNKGNPSGWMTAYVTKLNATGTALEYSTYLGGSNVDNRSFGIAVDADGSAYVTGLTDSFDFPTTPGAFQNARPNSIYRECAFVTKLSPDGTALEYSTYLGGWEMSLGFAIAVDSGGHAYVTGDSGIGFPVTPGAFLTTFEAYSAFVAKLNPSGTALVYGTYLGGGTGGWGGPPYNNRLGIALDAAGNAYVTGMTGGGVITTAGAYQTAHGGGTYDAFVSKLNADGSALLYSTFLGAGGDDRGRDIAVDAQGHAYVTGDSSHAAGFPTTPGAYNTTFPGYNTSFVTKLSVDGSALVYSTYLGATYEGRGIAVDAAGNANVVGTTGGTARMEIKC